jgi:hypothetical protein
MPMRLRVAALSYMRFLPRDTMSHREELVAWLRREGLWNAVSPAESAFLLADFPTEGKLIHATWRAEALLPLLWSLGLISELKCAVPTLHVR